ncbi:hypothetical protein GW575_03950 [Campylobacter sp. MIT 19-121]|uniref:cyclophilin-like fold protein n=1 Tax=Campylobacter sp. MIT 19-121 TaxID=2703906 RepID=UPI001389AB02|nr:cyclophilin-like fold protein [Campylobacter sp. MIT 19-121]NDJ27109.1 hypothetical protein [Campylobacter sp. MIT 19-121]
MKKIITLILFAFLSLRGEDFIVEFSFENGQSFRVKMQENEASKDFIALLPMSFKFNDHGDTEKVTHLEKALKTAEFNAYEPEIGDFFYYAPLQNIGFYYEKQGAFEGLFKMGQIIEKDKIKLLKEQKKDFILKARLINE